MKTTFSLFFVSLILLANTFAEQKTPIGFDIDKANQNLRDFHQGDQKPFFLIMAKESTSNSSAEVQIFVYELSQEDNKFKLVLSFRDVGADVYFKTRTTSYSGGMPIRISYFNKTVYIYDENHNLLQELPRLLLIEEIRFSPTFKDDETYLVKFAADKENTYSLDLKNKEIIKIEKTKEEEIRAKEPSQSAVVPVFEVSMPVLVDDTRQVLADLEKETVDLHTVFLLHSLKDQDYDNNTNAFNRLRLMNLRGQKFVELLKELLGHKTHWIRGRALDLLSKNKSDDVTLILIEALNDEHYNNTIKVFNELKSRNLADQKFIMPLKELLSHKTHWIRGRALDLLSKNKSDDVTLILIEALNDEGYDNTIKIFNELKSRNLTDQKFIMSLKELLKGQHGWIVDRAKELLSKAQKN